MTKHCADAGEAQADQPLADFAARSQNKVEPSQLPRQRPRAITGTMARADEFHMALSGLVCQ
jgi:hypothetical protein